MWWRAWAVTNLPSCSKVSSTHDKALLIAERIISELQTPFRLGTKEIFTSASIGIALSSPHYHQPEELLRDADAAMYNAKDGGRHRAAMFDDRLRREALSLLDMESDLRHALSRNEFEPFYQPIVELADGKVIGYEALLRWHHPERGLLTPYDFLLIADECGCTEAIDWQIFEQVCTQAVRLIGTEGFISINVSGRHFRSADLDQAPAGAVRRSTPCPTTASASKSPNTRCWKTPPRSNGCCRTCAAMASASRWTTSARAIRRSATCTSTRSRR